MPDTYETEIKIAHGIGNQMIAIHKEYSKNDEVAEIVMLELEAPEEVLKVCNAMLRWIKEFHPDFVEKSQQAHVDSRLAWLERGKDAAL